MNTTTGRADRMSLYQHWRLFRRFGNGPLHAFRKAWALRRTGVSVYLGPRPDGAISPPR